MRKSFVDYFMVLEVHLMATDPVIKAAYRKLCHKHHPDNGGNQYQLNRISEAYETLMDSERKKVYMQSYLEHIGAGGRFVEPVFQRSMYDFSIQPIRRSLLEYLFFIKNGAFEEAYEMLSKYNKKHIFKKDFIRWQSLIAQVHKLVEYDCTFTDSEPLELMDSRYLKGLKSIRFRVKVIEENKLLGKKEEDFFDRVMVYEESGWKVLIKQSNLRGTIKKYKKIVDLHDKQNNPLLAQRKGKDFTYSTGYVTRQTFLDNCEHEHLRYSRYHTVYSVISLSVNPKDDVSQIKGVLEKNTRILDSITYLKRGYFLILLPETNEVQGSRVYKKLKRICDSDIEVSTAFEGRCIMQRFASVKELLNEVMA